MGAPHAPPDVRLWRRVDKRDIPGGCWLWRGTTSGGYGLLRTAGRNVQVHRFSYEIAHGAIPEGVCVLHRCDVRNCVNPDHLFLGTRVDNNADMVAKGRQVAGDRNGSHLHPERRPRGERHPRAKLTEDQVREIRRRHAPAYHGPHRAPNSMRALAQEFGVSKSVLRNIVTGKTWNHVV
jgi:hypothetical protein